MVIGRIDIGAFPDYNDPDFYNIENGYAIIDYGYTAGAYEDILLNLAGELQAECFLQYVEEHDHGTFFGDGYIVEY